MFAFPNGARLLSCTFSRPNFLNNSVKYLHSTTKRKRCLFANNRINSKQSLKDYSYSVTKSNVPNLNFNEVSRLGFVRTVSRRCYCSTVRNEDSNRHTSDDEKNDGYLDLYQSVDFQEITNGDEELTKKLKVYLLEIEVLRQEGGRVPSKLSTEAWKDFLIIKSRKAREKFLEYLWMNEIKGKNDKKRKERKREIREEVYMQKVEDVKESGHILYGLNENTIFTRISDSTMNTAGNYRLFQAMRFGEDIVVDCSYDQYMTLKELNNCAKQLTYLFAQNRDHAYPFNVHFCNTDREGRMMQKLNKMIPTMYDLDFPMNVTEKHYLDLFPKERLVYLTPHCREDLLEYNHDDIYIIGAMVDKSNCEPLSLAKAKSEGLRMARFPLDRYLSWGIGTKSLTLDQSMLIMLEMKTSGDWEKALKHVPRRKIMSEYKDVPEDSVSRYGQNYVSHEWGYMKKRNRRMRGPYMDVMTMLKNPLRND